MDTHVQDEQDAEEILDTHRNSISPNDESPDEDVHSSNTGIPSGQVKALCSKEM